MKRVIATVLAAISLAQPAHATWNGPPEQWPEHARWTCEVMMKDLDGALEAGLSLHNSDFSLVNWVKDHLGYADRAAKLIMLRGANDLVNLAGGGRDGYFWQHDFIDQDWAPSEMVAVHATMVNWFQININNGSSCDLNDW